MPNRRLPRRRPSRPWALPCWVAGSAAVVLSQAAEPPPPTTRPAAAGTAPASAPAAQPGQPAADEGLAADEKAVAALIDDLAADDFPTRKAASDRLERAGPDVIPLLQKYVNDRNPEVAARVRAAIRSYVWMQRGAVLTNVTPGLEAERLGLRVGDVIGKVDDVDVDLHTDFAKATEGKPDGFTMFVWRAGKVRTVRATGKRLGLRVVNWDVAKGGNDQSRGLAAFAADPPDVPEAFRRLRAARDRGMDDPRSLQLLSGLAARLLDAKCAADAYAAYRVSSGYCSLTHNETDVQLGSLPFDSPHGQWLIGRYRREPFSTALYHELDDWAARHGRNGPLLAELLAKPWPAGPVDPTQAGYHELAAMHRGLEDRRYADVLTTWEGRTKRHNWLANRGTLALQAAVRGNRPADAAGLGLALIDPATRDPEHPPEPMWCGPALAAAAGDAAAAERFLDGLDALGPAAVAEAWRMRSVDALFHPAAAAVVRRWADRRPRPPGPPGRLDHVLLADTVADPAATADRFAAATAQGYDDPTKLDRALALTYVTGLLRFGRVDDARAAAAAIRPDGPMAARDNYMRMMATLTDVRIRRAAAFAADNAGKLAGAWKDLAGAIEVAPTPPRGPTWVMRYDGAVFRLGEDGAVTRPPGLPPPPAPVTVGYRHLRVRPGSVAVVFPFGRPVAEKPNARSPDLVYYLDPRANRWVEPAAYDGPVELGDARDTARAAAARAVAKGYPALPGGTAREFVEGDFRFYGFEGDVLVYADQRTAATTDLSADVGRLAGRPGPARVYPVRDAVPPLPPVTTGRTLLYSECGLWAFDPSAPAGADRLRRVPLGLGDEDVMTVELPPEIYGRRPDGRVAVGVAPQQGGRVFLVDLKTLAVEPTEGFCGLGPDDVYAGRRFRWRFYDPHAAIQAAYLARLAKGAGAAGAGK